MNRWKIVEGYFSFGARVSVVRSSCLGVDITSHRSKHVDEFAGQDFDCPTIGRNTYFNRQNTGWDNSDGPGAGR